MEMSGPEKIDVGSAQLTGLNESVIDFTNVGVEPSSGEGMPVYPNAVSGGGGEDGGVKNLDAGNCLGSGLSLATLGNKVPTCERVSVLNCSTDQQSGDGLDSANAVTEPFCVHGSESTSFEPVIDGTRTLNCDNVDTMGNSLNLIATVGRLQCMNEIDSGNCCGPVEDCGLTSTTKSEEKAAGNLSPGNGVNHTSSCDIVKLAEESVHLMQAATKVLALCPESQICEPSILENSIDQDSVRSKLSDRNVVLPYSSEPELDGDSFIPRENVVELPCKLNLQNGSINPDVEYSSYGVQLPCGQRMSPEQRTGGQHVLGDQCLPHQSLQENIGTQPLNHSTAQGNPMEDSSKNDHGNVSADHLLNKSVLTNNVVFSCSLSEGAANSSKVEQASETLGEGDYGGDHSQQLAHEEKVKLENATDITKEKLNAESNLNDGAQTSLVERVKSPHCGMSKSSGELKQSSPVPSNAKICWIEQTGSFPEEITEQVRVVVLGTPATAANEKSKRGRKPGKTAPISIEKKYALRSSVPTTMASRQENGAPLSNTSVKNTKGSTGRRGRKKRMELEGKPHDEFSKMRKHLRYLLHRIKYAHNLLDAYCSEGWRGQSLEKLRPEKELERAKADISRSKLKIRDLFQRLDSLSAEGKFPDSLYDSEGLIDSEDIFCAKCGSKDLSTGNDILLCDGVCERGFHQSCLEPPLRTEEIPPGDEGWLCPACECKDDCLDLLNDSQGTKLSIEDSWENVFPEVAAAAAAAAMERNELDDIMGLPSDDSEDNDYNPDGINDDVKGDGSESSSEESDSAESDSSDFSSASEDLGDVCGNEQNLGPPPDDSEDDDYDPDAANVNVDVEHEGSSSDFTSASEDLGAAVTNDGNSGSLEPVLPLLVPDHETGDPPSVSGRRNVEKLDYKKLYDETYGNASSDSSDDEEWMDMDAKSKGKGRSEKVASVSPNAGASVSSDGANVAHTPQRKGWKKLNLQAANGSPAQLFSTQKMGSSGKGIKRPPYNRIGAAVTQKLYGSFKENQYPDHQAREILAKELGLTPEKVNKWFGNARWTLSHHPGRIEASMAAAASRSNAAHNATSNEVEWGSTDASTIASKNSLPDSSKLDVKESDKSEATPKRRGKRKKTEDSETLLQTVNRETFIQSTQTNTSQIPEVQLGGVQRRRKSGAQQPSFMGQKF